jgi:lactoylglutathione lyase
MENDIEIELHVPDFEKIIDFYSKLGFKIVLRKSRYLIMQMGKTRINFYGGSDEIFQQSYFKNFPKDTKRGYAVEIAISMGDIEKFYEKVKKVLGKHIVQELKLEEWGKKDFRMEDPFGFYLRFGET